MGSEPQFSGEVVGVGIDLADVARIRGLLEKYGKSFLSRTFAEAEAAHCMARANPAEALAARFAAKEAVAKALGTGFSDGVSPRGIAIENAPSGAPLARLDEARAKGDGKDRRQKGFGEPHAPQRLRAGGGGHNEIKWNTAPP